MPPESVSEQELLKLGGRDATEARALGEVGQIESVADTMYPAGQQLVDSPLFQAVWPDGSRSLRELFSFTPRAARPDVQAVIDECVAIAARYKERDQLLGEDGKLNEDMLDELMRAGYFAMLVPTEHGGIGATMEEFTQLESRMTAIDYCLAILSSVHGCIGCVSPVARFGSPEQQQLWLPRLACRSEDIEERRSSLFGLTEPCAGSDTGACKVWGEIDGDKVVLYGEKILITNVATADLSRFPRLLSLVFRLRMQSDEPDTDESEEEFRVALVDLPREESDQFRVHRYGLNALERLHNYGMRFNGLRVPVENLLPKVEGADGRVVALWSLAKGRVSLAGLAAGAIRTMLANCGPWCHRRVTFGKPLAERQNIQGLVGEIAMLLVKAEALTAFAAQLFDNGQQNELEAMLAKIEATNAVTEALRRFKIVHGGRVAAKGHLFQRLQREIALMEIYEGANGILSPNIFRSLTKSLMSGHVGPILMILHERGLLEDGNPKVWSLLWPNNWGTAFGLLPRAWRIARKCRRSNGSELPEVPEQLAGMVNSAANGMAMTSWKAVAALRKHGKGLFDEQDTVSQIGGDFQAQATKMITACWAAANGDPWVIDAAQLLGESLDLRIAGKRPNTRFFQARAALGKRVLDGECPLISDITPDPLSFPYED